jgi:tetratricopeptide (TPR) repeat protein
VLGFALWSRAEERRDRRDLEGARALFTEGAAVFRELAREKPTPMHRHGLSFMLSRLGTICRALGDDDASRARFEEALVMDRDALGAEPESTEARENFFFSVQRAAEVREDAGDIAGARAAREEALDVATRLVVAKPSEANDSERAVALFKLARLVGATGAREEALSLLEEALAIDHQMLALIPGGPIVSHNLVLVLAEMAQLRAAGHDRDGAIAALDEAIAAARTATALVPEDARMRDDLGTVLGMRGRIAQARGAIEESLVVQRDLVARGGSDVDRNRRGLAYELEQDAPVIRALGDAPAATAALREAVAARRAIKDAVPQDGRALFRTEGGLAALEDAAQGEALLAAGAAAPPADGAAERAIGFALFYRGDLAAATARLERALADPRVAEDEAHPVRTFLAEADARLSLEAAGERAAALRARAVALLADDFARLRARFPRARPPRHPSQWAEADSFAALRGEPGFEALFK